jgi:hypothetical protein
MEEHKPRASGPVEPKPIIHIGGPLNGKKVADLGQTFKDMPNGRVYKRVKMDAGDGAGRVCFDVLAYFDKEEQNGEGQAA